MKRPIPELVTKAYGSIIANQHAELRDLCRDFRTLLKAVYDSEACKDLTAEGAALVACRVWARLETAPFFDKDFAEKYDVLNKVFPLHEWITGEPVVRKKEVPARATEIYTAIALNNEMCGPLKGLTFTELKDRVVSFLHKSDLPVAVLVSLRLWQKLKAFPSRDAAYCAQLKAETQVYDLDAWFKKPEPSTPVPDKAEDVSIKFRNIDYTELEARVMAEPQTYHRDYIDALRMRGQEGQILAKTVRGPRSLLISTPTGRDSWLDSEYATKEVSSTHQKVITMNANKPYETISYVYGFETATASDAHLIDSIKRVDTEINRLTDLKGTSKKVDAMIKSLEEDKAAIVAVLDSRL